MIRLAATASAGFLFADFGLFEGLWALGAELTRFEQFAHPAAGEKSIQKLAAGFLHLDFQPGGPMFQIDARRGAVDLLATGPLRADEGFLEVRFLQAAGGHSGPKFVRFLFSDTQIHGHGGIIPFMSRGRKCKKPAVCACNSCIS